MGMPAPSERALTSALCECPLSPAMGLPFFSGQGIRISTSAAYLQAVRSRMLPQGYADLFLAQKYDCSKVKWIYM